MRYTKFGETAHRAKAQSNLEFADAIRQFSSEHKDWRITATFYAAVHLLQAYFTARTTEYPQNHSDRDDLIIRSQELRPIYSAYRNLKDASVSSRFYCWPVNDLDVTEARRHFETIRLHVDRLLAAN